MPADGEATHCATLELLRSRSSAWLDATALPCAFHQENRAISACPACGRLLCESCANALGPLNCCPPCRKELAKAGFLQKIRTALFNPALWVLLCIAVAAGLYTLGVGNPNIAEMQKMDSHKSWNDQEAPKLYLAQGAREKRRAAILAEQGNASEAARWYALSSEAFKKSAELWGNAPSAFAPNLAAAETLSLAGHPKEALALALKIKPPADEADIMDFNYVMGRIASAADNASLARSFFQTAYAKAQTVKAAPLEGVIAAFTIDRREASFGAKVRLVSGLNADPADVLAKCRQHIDAKNLPQKDEEDSWRRMPAQKQDNDFQIEIVKPKGGAR